VDGHRHGCRCSDEGMTVARRSADSAYAAPGLRKEPKAPATRLPGMRSRNTHEDESSARVSGLIEPFARSRDQFRESCDSARNKGVLADGHSFSPIQPGLLDQETYGHSGRLGPAITSTSARLRRIRRAHRGVANSRGTSCQRTRDRGSTRRARPGRRVTGSWPSGGRRRS